MKGLFGKDRVCGVVAAETARKMIAQGRAGLRLTSTQELRLDYLRDAQERIRFLKWLARWRGKATWIATCRRRAGGGLFSGGIGEQLEVLSAAVRAGCQWCDVEIETAGEASGAGFRERLAPASVMVSYHNFKKTPPNLPRVAKRLRDTGADAIKVAAQCSSFADAVRLAELPRRNRNVVAIPMGETGMAGRILALRSGSALAYAAIEGATAPGQLTLQDMIGLYRAAELTPRTRVYGVIGNPIGHSLSPLLHNTGFRARRFDAVLAPFLVRDLRDFLKAVKPLGIAGFAVTIPHKEAILDHLDGCDPLAGRIGAVNTVVVRGGGRLYGYNTDYTGVLRSLEGHMQLAGGRVLLVGAGGAARAAAFALVQAGAVVGICARRASRARELAHAAGGYEIPRGELGREFFDVIVNCTPVGMFPHGGSPLRAEELNCRLVMDMVYRPRDTELLRLARRRGIGTISGVEMFLTQGYAQYEIWTGERAAADVIRRAIVGELARAEKTARAATQGSAKRSKETARTSIANGISTGRTSKIL